MIYNQSITTSKIHNSTNGQQYQDIQVSVAIV